MIYDTFMIAGELDMLECRLTELADVPDLIHVAVEADVDHQNHPKPYVLSDNIDRFAPWADRLRVIRATDLPTTPDPWDREHAQREWVAYGVKDATDTDVILHGDVDEIPTDTFARCVQPRTPAVAGMRFHCFAVDWLHPEVWPGTVAAFPRHISSFSEMRDLRLRVPPVPGSGWHFTWIGGHAATLAKIDTFCHPEVLGWAGEAIAANDLYTNGYHVDGCRLEPVEVAARRWPRWVAEGHAPADWFRPRDIERRTLDLRPGRIVKPA